MDRRDFLKTVAITGAALSIQHSEAMEILTQTINNTNGGNPDLVAVMGGEPEAMFRRAISELGGMKQFVKPGQKVVVKPNIGWDKVPELAGNTNPQLIAEIVKQCFAAGAKEVTVFDHTCDDWQKCYKNSGIEAAAKAAGAKVVGTGRSDFPNQVNNVIAFPGIFKGALEGRATAITEEMKLATAKAIAGLVPDEELNENNILPEAFDPRVSQVVSEAVKALI